MNSMVIFHSKMVIVQRFIPVDHAIFGNMWLDMFQKKNGTSDGTTKNKNGDFVYIYIYVHIVFEWNIFSNIQETKMIICNIYIYSIYLYIYIYIDDF